jgi:predicted metal-dependent enzyme (double-stranded beta helix superfamily)
MPRTHPRGIPPGPTAQDGLLRLLRTRLNPADAMTLTAGGTPGITRFTPAQLLRTARLFARDPDLSALLGRADTGPRREHLLEASPHLVIWLVAWPPGCATAWHRHEVSSGALLVIDGLLIEQSAQGPTVGATEQRLLVAQDGRTFPGVHHHRLANPGTHPALSIHVHATTLA